MDDVVYVMAFPADSVESLANVVQPLETIAARSLYNPLKLDLSYTTNAYGGNGLSGNPVPYKVRNDSTLSILLLLCFVCYVLSLAHSKPFLYRQLKNILRPPHLINNDNESGGEQRIMVFLSIVNALVLAVVTSLLVSETMSHDLLSQDGIIYIAVFFVSYLLYYCLKWMVGAFVNLVFFGVKKYLQWQTLQLQLATYVGVLLLPMLVLQFYFDLSVENALFYIGVVLFLNKIITFYKSFQIFFQGNGLYLQTFLYFCALEIVPLLAFGCAGLAIVDLMEINF